MNAVFDPYEWLRLRSFTDIEQKSHELNIFKVAKNLKSRFLQNN